MTPPRGLAAGTVMIVMKVMAAIAYRSDMLEPAIFAAALAAQNLPAAVGQHTVGLRIHADGARLQAALPLAVEAVARGPAE